MPYVGSSVPGLLDAQLVAGRGQYTADVSLPEMGYMAVVRSPYAHARIASIDVREAASHPKVRRVVTGEDIKKLTDPIPHAIDPRTFGGKGTDVYCLALDRVRYVGEPVAALVADDKYAAAEALDLIQVEYEELPVVVDAEKALAANAPFLYPEWGTNEMLRVHFQGGKVDQAFAEAD